MRRAPSRQSRAGDGKARSRIAQSGPPRPRSCSSRGSLGSSTTRYEAAAPIAARTWLGPTLPDEQAAPALTMTPSRSSAMTWVSAAVPGIAIADVFGRRPITAPSTIASGADRDDLGFECVAQIADAVDSQPISPPRLWRRRRSRRCREHFRCRRGVRAPVRRPAAAATDRAPPATTSAPTPAGRRAYVQTRSTDRRRSRPYRAGILPAACTASQWTEGALRVSQRRDLGRRLHDAGFVVGEHDRNQRRPRFVREKIRRAPSSRDDTVADRPGSVRPREPHATPNHARPPTPARASARSPSKARWFASVPPLTKTTPSGAAPTNAATAVAAALDRLPARPGPSDGPRRDCRNAPAPQPSPPSPPAATARSRSNRDRSSGRVRPPVAHRGPVAAAVAANSRNGRGRWCRARGARTHRRATPSSDRGGSGCPAPPINHGSDSGCGCRGSRSARRERNGSPGSARRPRE